MKGFRWVRTAHRSDQMGQEVCRCCPRPLSFNTCRRVGFASPCDHAVSPAQRQELPPHRIRVMQNAAQGDNAAALPRDTIWVSGCLQQGGTAVITLCFSREFPRAAKMPQSLLRPRLHHRKTLPPTCRHHPPKAVFG